jgi:hypothetical protein
VLAFWRSEATAGKAAQHAVEAGTGCRQGQAMGLGAYLANRWRENGNCERRDALERCMPSCCWTSPSLLGTILRWCGYRRCDATSPAATLQLPAFAVRLCCRHARLRGSRRLVLRGDATGTAAETADHWAVTRPAERQAVL